MARVSGVGGAFVSAQDPTRLGQWYADQLGAETDASAHGLLVRADADQAGHTDGTTWSVSFDVDDLDAMVAQLRAAGTTVDVDPATTASGGVAWVHDPEGNLIRLVESTSTGRVWSSQPDAVRVFDDEPEPERRPRGVWRSRVPWLALLLAGVLAVAMVVRQQTGADQADPAPEPGPTDQDVSVVDVGEPVLDGTADWELIARGQGAVSRIEFAEGRVTTTQLPQFDGSGPVSLLSGPDWTIVRPVDDALGYLVPDGRPARVLQGALGGGGRISLDHGRTRFGWKTPTATLAIWQDSRCTQWRASVQASRCTSQRTAPSHRTTLVTCWCPAPVARTSCGRDCAARSG